MKMFSDCAGSCITCRSSGGGCLAGHGDDHYSAISKKEAISRIERGRHPVSRFTGKPGRLYTPSELTQLRKHAGLDPLPEPGHSSGEWPQCCPEAEQYILWGQQGAWGWSIDVGHRVTILFCPWCGKRLT